MNPVKDISCSHCAGRAISTSRWSLMYPHERCFFLFSLCRAIYSCSHMAGLHKCFSCTLYEFDSCLRTHQECYLLSFIMLVAVVGAGDRVEFVPLLPYTRGHKPWFHFCSPILQKTRSQRFLDMNERRMVGKKQRWAVYLLTQWPQREQFYNKSTCDIIASPWRGDTRAQ